jgi:hypothetical protein
VTELSEPFESASGTEDTDLNFPADWPPDVQQGIRDALSADIDKLVGRNRLGELAFEEIRPVLGRIGSALADLTEESWGDLPVDITHGQLTERLNALNQVIAEIRGFDLNTPEPANTKASLVQRLNEILDWFNDKVRPYTVNAIARRAVQEVSNGNEQLAQAQEIDQLLNRLRVEQHDVARELESRRDLLKGLREVSGESASDDLAVVFANRADALEKSAGRWLKALIGSGLAATGVAVAVYVALHPHEAAEPSDVGRLTLSVFILGLVVYAVRVCAQRYRATSHLEAVSRSKAAALLTFNRFSSAVEEESVRSAVALTLAQAVFATEETGFIDGTGDQITLVDHALRLPSAGAGAGS